jgi:hypothetical protein
MLMQILLFWYVISKAVEIIIIDKSLIVREIFQNSTLLQKQIKGFLNSESYSLIYNQSLIDQKQRNEYNVELTWQWMMIPFSVVIAVLSFGLIYSFYVHRYTSNNTLKLDRTDIIILLLLFLCFLTELIFIFTLVMRYVYVSDMDMVVFMMTSGIVNVLPLPTFSPFTLPPAISPYVPTISPGIPPI